MSQYFKSLGLYMAMFVMIISLTSFILYYSSVGSLKQDTYKNFMYDAMNKSTLRMEGAEGLANGDFNAYYLGSDGTYNQLELELVRQIGLTSKMSGSIEYELIQNKVTNEYYLHVESTTVDSVIKFKLEDGRK